MQKVDTLLTDFCFKKKDQAEKKTVNFCISRDYI